MTPSACPPPRDPHPHPLPPPPSPGTCSRASRRWSLERSPTARPSRGTTAGSTGAVFGFRCFFLPLTLLRYVTLPILPILPIKQINHRDLCFLFFSHSPISPIGHAASSPYVSPYTYIFFFAQQPPPRRHVDGVGRHRSARAAHGFVIQPGAAAFRWPGGGAEEEAGDSARGLELEPWERLMEPISVKVCIRES